MFYNNFNGNPFMNFTDTKSAFDAWASKADQFSAPARQMAAMSIDKFDKMTQAQAESYRRYAAIAIENAQAAMSIHDFASYQSYLESQKDVMKQVADQVSTDARAYADLGSSYASSVRETTEAAVQEAVKATKA